MKHNAHAITMGDLIRVLLRSLLLQASWSFDWMQSLGFAYAMVPALKRLYPDGPEFRERLNAHREYFNTQPYLASYILGAVVKMEEERASGRNSAADISSMKSCLMPSLGALGDSFFWGALKPFAASMGVALVLTGFWWGPVVFLVLYSIWHVGLRTGLLFYGYQSTGEALSIITRFNFNRTTRTFKAIAVSVLGGIIGMAPAWRPELRFPLPAAGPVLIIAGGMVTLLLIILLRKGGSPVKLMLGLAVVCVILSYLGVEPW